MDKGGFPFYGQNVGILVFSGSSPRICGDPGHASTFDYPVCYEIIDGEFTELVEGSIEIKEKLIQAVESLKKRGVKAVIGDCGLMALYQEEMAARSELPVLSSSLILIPLIWNMLGRSGYIGLITGHSKLLKEHHLKNAGVNSDIPLLIQGMEGEPHFKDIVIDGNNKLNPELMEKDVLSAVKKLINRSRRDDCKISAILLECSNLATYSKSVYMKTKIPVFDITAACGLIKYCVNPRDYLQTK